ncbi:TRAF3-interacting JNK-activating modulator isoform X2 [Myripristis murdjan]|uniref:TRAF3-interacting JNK-activating modulator isoform X1 n=1 Tax=Myripristis murdjan TaxID=586833 RepID=UPI001176031D|nr:TRAF3-interacting JNK-activating modulator isoform X1 [Myripristis murdjan]XP_029912319.1 TRAF3-interacting JNK-activating modulator isoform X2 [Myripristis murdjan]
MDSLDVNTLQPFLVKDFEQLLQQRAEKHEHLRGRNNVTSCRSPTREFDTKLVKNVLQEKRHLEFLRRRSVSPEKSCVQSVKAGYRPSKKKRSAKTRSVKHQGPITEPDTMHTNIHMSPTPTGHPMMIPTPGKSVKSDDQITNTWVSLWAEPVAQSHTKKQAAHASTSTPVIKGATQQRVKSNLDKRENSINGKKTSTKTITRTEKIHQTEKLSLQTERVHQKKILREAGVQTESGFVTVKESDIQLLAGYLQEALWREEVVKKKLISLQDTASTLLHSSNKIWTARCSEDLLKNKIKALEAQLQVCLQKFPKNGVKKLVLQMEEQKLVYEEKALAALQKATQEKTEALSKAETLQEALLTAKAESLRWQSLYEELKLSSSQLKESRDLSDGQLQQLHSQLQLSQAREAELREELVSVQQEKEELQYNISLLEEDNQTLREEIQYLRDGGTENEGVTVQVCLPSEEAEQYVKRESDVGEQLHHTQNRLKLKEKECEELQKDLDAMEQECQSSQARLTQCRDELRQLSHRRSSRRLCSSWWRVCVFLLLFLAVSGVAMLWLWHPPFREQVEDVYSDIEMRIEDYLMQMASPQHSGCFRPM